MVPSDAGPFQRIRIAVPLGPSSNSLIIIYFTKVHMLLDKPLHGIKPHFFFGLAAEADARN